MKQKRNAQKVRYFKKDYKPAVFAANQRKARKSSSQFTKTMRQIGKSTGSALKSTGKAISNFASQAARAASRQNQPTNYSAKRARRRAKRQPMSWREGVLLTQVSVSALAIIFTFVFCEVNDPVRRSQEELERIANAYYIEYLYPSSLGKYLYKPEMILKDYVTSGLPTVKLRQLMLYNDGEYAKTTNAFDNPDFACDYNETTVRYYPVEPYGPRDVTVRYNTVCGRIGD